MYTRYQQQPICLHSSILSFAMQHGMRTRFAFTFDPSRARRRRVAARFDAAIGRKPMNSSGKVIVALTMAASLAFGAQALAQSNDAVPHAHEEVALKSGA